MRILLQRVRKASVSVDGEFVGSIDRGYLLLLGVMQGDTEEQASWLAHKIAHLRLFDAQDGKVNDRSILDIGGEVLVVSQFTLAGDFAKGNRPDYTAAAAPAHAIPLYEFFIDALRKEGVSKVESGTFGAMMEVSLINDGPVTLWLERVPG
ncbi:MAG: D-aminoacyl-tRNA deacylase [Candidatus Peribacteraceae bacterium]|nr:D-aminoacyl-tRNA deacylase [Candidatus Peribacteraceae bacterium]